MPITNIENFRGGLSLVEPTNMDDNQFEVLQNIFYNQDKKAQTRRGIKTFGNAIGSDPITSYFFFQNDTTGVRMALCTAGTDMYKYDEGTSTWNSIKSGLTEFEADGTTRTRWSFAVYLNTVYACNGIDAYASYDGTTYTEYGSQPKCRYLKYMADSIYGAGDDSNPSKIYGTTAGAADATLLNANDLIVGGDELGRINGIRDLGNLILVFKNKKIYTVAGDLASSEAIDSQNGGFSHRAIANVENALMYYNDAGVDTVKARSGLSGASALATESKSDDLQTLLSKITPSQYNSNVGYYNNPLHNYYFSFDTGNDSIPDKTLVYSSLVGGWSQYNLPALYDYGFYIDDDGEYHYLISSANGGQMYEIETGFTDFDQGILTELKTKRWDFGDIGLWKTFDNVDIQGYKNRGSEINIEILVDGEVVNSAILNDTFANVTSSAVSIGSQPIGVEPIGGGSGTGEDIDLFPYIIRLPMYASGPNIQIRMYSNDNPNVWTLDKIKISRDDEVMDIFPTINIA